MRNLYVVLNWLKADCSLNFDLISTVPINMHIWKVKLNNARFLVCIFQIPIKQSTFTKITESIHLFISKLSRIYFKTLLDFLCGCRASANTIRKIKQDVII